MNNARQVEHLLLIFRILPRLGLNSRTYNSEQLAVKLREERRVSLSSTQIRRILKKAAGVGNGLEQAIVPSKTLT